jgi:hypothetical protein
MSLPAQMQRDSDVQYDARIARAIDRVLEAGRLAKPISPSARGRLRSH